MPDLRLCAQTEIYDYCGDVAALRQLLGSAPGVAVDAAFLDRCIVAASADVEGSAANKFLLVYSQDPTTYPPLVRRWTATLAAEYCWIFKGKGAAMPPVLKDLAERVRADLQKVEEGKKGAGQNGQPRARMAGYSTVDLTRGGEIPRMSLAGARRGFV